MAYQEEHANRNRTVVETPNARREVVHSEAVRYPERQREGLSAAVLAAVVVIVVAMAAIVILFMMNRQQEQQNLAAQESTVQQPAAQQPPVIVQQPAPATQPAPVIITQPAPAAPASGGSASRVSADLNVQAAVDKRLSDDPNLSSLGIVATVLDGMVTLIGTVKREAIKSQVERAIKGLRGVKSIANQISVV